MVKPFRLPVLVAAVLVAALSIPASAGAVPTVGTALGTVTAVDGATTAGSCGTSGAAGTVTVATRTGARTVLVTATTTFIDPRVASPSYASVCVGRTIGAGGPVASGVVTAAVLVVAPPPPVVAVGLVTAVNGVSTAGTCGTAGAAGSFVLSTRTGTSTVAVSATTTAFVGVPSASFAKVCVNGVVAAAGSGSPIDAFRVIVTSFSGPLTAAPLRTIGTVTAVDGVSTPGTCGTAGAAGSFVLATRTGARTISVAPDTAFIDPRVATDTFGSVCVGRTVGALGTAGSSPSCLAVGCPTAPIDAKLVVVVGSVPSVLVGLVSSVNGVSTPGTCGTAGGTGSFGILTRTGTATVNVALGTSYRGVLAPSFAKVCVGRVVAAVGTGTTTIDALRVVVTGRSVV
ncbi:MAG: hypothetical protein ACKOBG_05690 [Actinomycetota bacterium]